jgi:hypothetical protein
MLLLNKVNMAIVGLPSTTHPHNTQFFVDQPIIWGFINNQLWVTFILDEEFVPSHPISTSVIAKQSPLNNQSSTIQFQSSPLPITS